jgi:hypothetical protein
MSDIPEKQNDANPESTDGDFGPLNTGKKFGNYPQDNRNFPKAGPQNLGESGALTTIFIFLLLYSE